MTTTSPCQLPIQQHVLPTDFGANRYAWSYTAWRLWRSCPRAWWLKTNVAWGGWERSASPAQRLAYRLGKMTSYLMYAGLIVHEMIADHILSRAAPPADYRAMIGDRLSQAEQAHIERRWEADPKKHPPISELYYAEPNNRETYSRGHRRAVGCMTTFYSRAETFHYDRFLTIPDADPILVDTATCPVWVQFDLAHYDAATHRVLVRDWKTGKPRNTDRQQGMIQAAMAYRIWGCLSHAELDYLETDEIISIDQFGPKEHADTRSPEAIATLAAFFAAGKALAQRGNGMNWMPEDACPPNANAQCRYCNYVELCQGHRDRASACPRFARNLTQEGEWKHDDRVPPE